MLKRLTCLKQRLLPVILISMMITITGCSTPPPVVVRDTRSSVHGNVRTSEDRPVTAGQVCFHPIDPKISPEVTLEIETDGSFRNSEGFGLIPGEYRVTIAPMSYRGGSKRDLPLVVPSRFRDVNETPIRVVIEAGVNEIPPIVLK